MARNAKRIEIFGFVTVAHIVTQIAAHEGREIYASVREGDTERKHLPSGLVQAGQEAYLICQHNYLMLQ